jgi:regulatory protein
MRVPHVRILGRGHRALSATAPAHLDPSNAAREAPMPFKAKATKPPLTQPELLDFAVRSLSSKMKSVRDLRRKLADRAEPGEQGTTDIDAVIAKLKDLGYLSDERFAADYTRLRKENEKFGRRRVQQGLMQKGIAAPLVNETLGAAYDEVDEVALAREYIARKRMKKPEGDREKKQKETAKAMRRLVAAGFSTKAIWKVLRDWGAEIEETDVGDPE